MTCPCKLWCRCNETRTLISRPMIMTEAERKKWKGPIPLVEYTVVTRKDADV